MIAKDHIQLKSIMLLKAMALSNQMEKIMKSDKAHPFLFLPKLTTGSMAISKIS
jgi:hypothetical protein